MWVGAGFYSHGMWARNCAVLGQDDLYYRAVTFTDWIAFGGPVLRSGDPVEQEKRIKYRDLVANAMMLHNVVDMTNVLRQLQQEGVFVTPEVVSRLSPYLTEHIKRFGQYILDMDTQPEPLQPKPLFAPGL